MKKTIIILITLLGFLILYVLYVCVTTGAFRTIDNTYSGSIERIDIPGAEDFAISRSEGFIVISSDDRAGRRDGKDIVSGLYWMDIDGGSKQPQLMSADRDVPLYPHGISMMRIDTHVYRLLVVNHVTTSSEAVSSLDPDTEHSIEEYMMTSTGELTHIKTHKHDLIYSPNDVVAAEGQGFYFTNDHGSKTKLGLILEDYLGLKRSNVVYYDGEGYQIVDRDIAYANGINIDFDRDLMYVASPRDMLVKVYDINEDGSLAHQVDIDCDSGVDNIELDDDGKIWIGCHPKLLVSSMYFEGGRSYSPSEIITIDYETPYDYTVSSEYVSDGTDMSASTVAIPYQGRVYVGNVMDDHFIVLDQDHLPAQ